MCRTFRAYFREMGKKPDPCELLHTARFATHIYVYIVLVAIRLPAGCGEFLFSKRLRSLRIVAFFQKNERVLYAPDSF